MIFMTHQWINQAVCYNTTYHILPYLRDSLRFRVSLISLSGDMICNHTYKPRILEHYGHGSFLLLPPCDRIPLGRAFLHSGSYAPTFRAFPDISPCIVSLSFNLSTLPTISLVSSTLAQKVSDSAYAMICFHPD